MSKVTEQMIQESFNESIKRHNVISRAISELEATTCARLKELEAERYNANVLAERWRLRYTQALEALHDRRFGFATGIEAIVCEDIAKRQKRGMEKYGTTVAENPLELKEWLTHAYEETLDAAVYLRRAIADIEEQKKGME